MIDELISVMAIIFFFFFFFSSRRRHTRLTCDWSSDVCYSDLAGDAFGGEIVAGWLATSDAEAAVERGWVSAGLALENWGAQGFMGFTPEMAEERRREWAAARARADRKSVV